MTLLFLRVLRERAYHLDGRDPAPLLLLAMRGTENAGRPTYVHNLGRVRIFLPRHLDGSVVIYSDAQRERRWETAYEPSEDHSEGERVYRHFDVWRELLRKV